MKKTVFISHGDSSKDNAFTKWLALKLIGLGYDVWCDILFLDKGVDFWRQIDSELRNNTCKCICVLSSFSNRREGVLKELAVAEKVKKQFNDDTFIIPVVIDENLSYDDINIELLRLNAIDFKNSWAAGLRELLAAFDKQKVPCNSPDPSRSNLLFQQIFLHDKTVIEGEELYDSNWFSVQSFPNELRFHDYDWRLPRDFDVTTLKFPATRFKNYLATFAWAYDFIDELPKTEAYESSRSVSIPVSEILAGQIKIADFIYPSAGQRLIVDLTNQAVTRSLGKRDLRQYQMSHRIGYWIEKGKLEKNKHKNVQLLGKALSNTWHFGISAAAKLYPMPVLTISSHIYFTTNGVDLIESDSIQHAARRRQGKNWWNETWRRKLLAFVDYLSDEDILTLDVGSDEKIVVASTPNQFLAPFTYAIPSKNTLSEEAEIANMRSFDELDEQEGEIGDTQ
jgi:TIR domain